MKTEQWWERKTVSEMAKMSQVTAQEIEKYLSEENAPMIDSNLKYNYFDVVLYIAHRQGKACNYIPKKSVYCVNCRKKMLVSLTISKKYCSNECKKEYKRKQRIKICSNCLKPFECNRKNQKYCSHRCSEQSQVDKVTLVCGICSKEYQTVRSQEKRKYCSRVCAKEAYRRDIVERWSRGQDRKCSKCNQVKSWDEFTKVDYKTSSVCKKCANEYARRRYKDNLNVRLKARDRRHARKILENKGMNEPMILESKSISCYWCRKILFADEVTVDHIVPLSKGGSNLRYNKVFSCRSCNCSKGAKNPNEIKHGQLELLYDQYKTA